MRRYLFLLASLVVATIVMSIQDMALIVILFTLGLGLPLAFAATGVLYLLCAYPAVTLWRNGGRERLMGLALAAAAVTVAAVAPSLFGRWNMEQGAAALRAADFVPPKGVAAASLEIRRPQGDDYEAGSVREPCGVECRALLLTGKVRSVRVVKLKLHDRKNPETRTFHTLERGAACSVPGSATPAEETCVVMSADTGEPADLMLTFEQLPITDLPGDFDLVRWSGTRRVTAHARRDGKWVEVLRQTGIDAQVAFAPTLVGVKFGGTRSAGLELSRTRHRVHQPKLADTLSKLGFDIGSGAAVVAADRRPRDWRQGIDDTMTREMIAVLDLPPATVFNTEHDKVLSDWMMHARQVKEWSPELIGVLRRIVRDQRIKHVSFFDQVFERNARVAEALLPDVLDMLEARGFSHDNTPARQAGYTLARLEPALLMPHKDRFVAAIASNGELSSLLRPVAGRLGVDPLPLLEPFAADIVPDPRGKRAYGLPRLKGACFADKQWAPRLIPALRAALVASQQQADRRVIREYQPAVLKALANLGDVDFVEQQLSTREDKEAAWLLRQIRSDRGPRRGVNALCYF